MNKFRILLSQVVKKSHFQTRNFYENLIDGAIDSGGVYEFYKWQTFHAHPNLK